MKSIPNSVLENLSGLVGAVDINYKYIYLNHYACKLYGYSSPDDLYGFDHFSIRCPAVSSAENFIAQDAYVIEKNCNLRIIDIHTYADNQPRILMTNKSPLIQDDVVIGSIHNCVEIKTYEFSKLCTLLTTSDRRHYSNEAKKNRSYTLDYMAISQNLTDREKECVFLLCRGLTNKMIAKCLGISHRTAETHVENIKQKWSCHTKSQIIESAVEKGFLTYIPKSILTKDLSIILGDVQGVFT